MGTILSSLRLILPKYAPSEIPLSVCTLWCDAVEEFSDEIIYKAFKHASQNLTEFPTPATIKRLCLGSSQTYEEIAQETAVKIEAAISRIGSNRYDINKDSIERHNAKLKEAVGDIGMEVIRLMGGWNIVCEVDYDGLISLRKQLRDLSNVVCKRKFLSGFQTHELPSGKQNSKALQEAINIACGGNPVS